MSLFRYNTQTIILIAMYEMRCYVSFLLGCCINVINGVR